MKHSQLDNLVSPGFVIGLIILLSNDFVLKQHFHNEITGKLSDFAGLLVFSIFWSSLFPSFKLQIHFFTAALFIFWKSPYSQPAIDGWNSVSIFSIGRTIDYSDLLALLVLPISYLYTGQLRAISRHRWATGVFAVISIFAFAATSFIEKTAYENEYNFSFSKKDLLSRMSLLPKKVDLELDKDSNEFDVVFNDCVSKATIVLSEATGQSTVRLKEIDFRCPGSYLDKEEKREFFEREFINRLKEDSSIESSKIDYIGAVSSANDKVETTK